VAVLARRNAGNDPYGRFLDLSGAILTGLSLPNVQPRNLANAWLNGTNLVGTNLKGADLEARNITAAQLAEAHEPLAAVLDQELRTELEALLAAKNGAEF